jgi:hypothetical protein
MRTVVFFVAFVAGALSASAQNITFTNKTATFTNLEGQVYRDVALVRADLDGLIWRDENGSGGRICFTNLSQSFLDTLGIPPERVAVAKARAERRAVSEAQYRAAAAAEAQAQGQKRQEEQAKWAAGAPARARLAQQKAELEAIDALRAQIQATEDKLERQRAVAHEATMQSPDTSYYVVGDSLIQDDLRKAKRRLAEMEAAYDAKYLPK